MFFKFILMKKKRLLIIVNVDWFFISHRIPIAETALREGWDVFVATQNTGRALEISKKGINFYEIPFSRSGTNLLNELKIVIELFKLFFKIEPDIVHNITLKPVIYGSLISRITKTKGTLNAISGLGYNFTEGRKGFLQTIMLKLMKFGFLQKNLAIIFQNNDDLNEIKEYNVLSKYNKSYLIKGSGVDLKYFKKEDIVPKDKLEVLFPARMLRDKGLEEFIGAANILKDNYNTKIVFILAGKIDTDNKAGISENYLKKKIEEGYIEWIGHQDSMLSVYKNADIVVLPSYREGLPKALIEACAIGRPIITTDAIGCKDCVDEGVNGFKVPIRSVVELAKAIEILILSSDLRKVMGNNSRIKAEKEFSLSSVVDKHISIYSKLYNAKK